MTRKTDLNPLNATNVLKIIAFRNIPAPQDCGREWHAVCHTQFPFLSAHGQAAVTSLSCREGWPGGKQSMSWRSVGGRDEPHFQAGPIKPPEGSPTLSSPLVVDALGCLVVKIFTGPPSDCVEPPPPTPVLTGPYASVK